MDALVFLRVNHHKNISFLSSPTFSDSKDIIEDQKSKIGSIDADHAI